MLKSAHTTCPAAAWMTSIYLSSLHLQSQCNMSLRSLRWRDDISHSFCSCDLDLDLMTLIYTILTCIFWRCIGKPKINFLGQRFQEHYRQRDRQRDRQTDRQMWPNVLSQSHTRVLNIHEFFNLTIHNMRILVIQVNCPLALFQTADT